MLEAAFIEARHSHKVNPAFSGTAAIHHDHAQRGRARGDHRRARGVTGVTAGTGSGSQQRCRPPGHSVKVRAATGVMRT